MSEAFPISGHLLLPQPEILFLRLYMPLPRHPSGLILAIFRQSLCSHTELSDWTELNRNNNLPPLPPASPAHCSCLSQQFPKCGTWTKSISDAGKGKGRRSVVSDSATPWTVAHQAPLSMGFSRQEYWRVLPFPSPGDLPNPGIEPMSPAL